MQAMLVCGFEEARAWGWWAQKESEEVMGILKEVVPLGGAEAEV